ncbi:MAG TPA: glycosyltransferase [Nocardioides sp.]|nr:glycosyltransferase [Nocardioides sp.]
MVSEHASPLAVLGGVDAGGQNVHVAAVSTALAARGHTVTVYTRRDDAALDERVPFAPGVEVVNVTAGPARSIPKDHLLPYMDALADGIRADCLRTRPDVIHAHFWMSGVAALRAAQELRAHDGVYPLPVVQTFHALGTVKRRHQKAEDTSPVERRTLEPWVGRTVDGVLATCSDEVTELRALGVDPATISVAPCGVDTDLLSPEGPAVPKGRRFRIGVVGRLVPRKGVDLVIHALARLRADGWGDLELVIVGGGEPGPGAKDPEVTRLQAIARELGVADRVIFQGRVPHDELPETIRSCDAIVCAPWYEPFGIVPLEAMACGVPVVGAAVGGLLDSVVDGSTGILVPPRDPEAIASAVARVLSDPALARRLGANGRRRAVDLYTWDRVAALTEECYRKLLETSQSVAMTGNGARV